MKPNRLLGLVAIALLALGAVGAISIKAYAPSHAALQAQDCTQDQDDAAETAETGADVDSVEVQCGDQNGPDDGPEGQEAGEAGSADGNEAPPSGTPAIGADVAQAAAEAYLNAGTATAVELDEENGKLIYSVEFSNGTDVKVDAMTGSILGVETGED